MACCSCIPSSWCSASSAASASRPFQGEAFDLILIQSAEDPSLIDCGDVLHSLDMDLPDHVRRGCTLTMEIEQKSASAVGSGNNKKKNDDVATNIIKFPINNNKICLPYGHANNEMSSQPHCPPMERGGDLSERRHQHAYNNNKNSISHDRQALQLLAALTSRHPPGIIAPRYVLRRSSSGSFRKDKSSKKGDYSYDAVEKHVNDDDSDSDHPEVVVAIASGFSIHVWSSTDRVVVFDIDGTITRSNIRGFIDTLVTENYQYTHSGVCQFVQELLTLSCRQDQQRQHEEENGTYSNDNIDICVPPIRFVYLSSRPYATASKTRKFLAEMRQRQHRLPSGPLLGSAKTIWQVLYMERVTKDAHVFKGSTLLSNIVRPWKAVVGTTITLTSGDVGTGNGKQNNNDCRKSARDFFLAGFGNQTSDAQAYHTAGMDPSQIYVINKQSQIRCLDGGTSTKLYSDDNANGALRRATKDVDYARRQGTHFVHGYRDKQLRKHVFRHMSSSQPEEDEAPMRII